MAMNAAKMTETEPFQIAELAASLVARLQGARTKMLAYGVKLDSASRLDHAADILTQLADAGEAQEADGLIEIIRALWFAIDVTGIAAGLPKQRIKSIRQELEVVCNGEFWPEKGARQSLQLQSQHWVLAVLNRAGLKIRHIPFNGKSAIKSPEFFIENGVQSIGIEVKRPESEAGIVSGGYSNNKKINAHDTPGGIILEASDIFEGRFSPGVAKEAQRLADVANARIWAMPDAGRQPGFQPGFQRVMYAGLILRGIRFTSPDKPDRLRLGGIICGAHFAISNTLHDHRAAWLHERIHEAFDQYVQAALAGDWQEDREPLKRLDGSDISRTRALRLPVTLG